MVKQKTIDKYTKFIGKNFGCIHVDDIDLSEANKNRVYFFCTCKSYGFTSFFLFATDRKDLFEYRNHKKFIDYSERKYIQSYCGWKWRSSQI